jgi:hypothetical protein
MCMAPSPVPGPQLFVGTKDGHLLMYGVTPRPGGGEHNVQLLRSYTLFALFGSYTTPD